MVLAAAVMGANPSLAEIGKTYLTAYSKKKGSQAKAGKFGRQIRLLRPAEVRKKKRPTKAMKSAKGAKAAKARAKRKMPPNSYTEQVRYCGKSYYTTKRGKRWIAAHNRARHVLLVRLHKAKRKYAVICGTKPKGPARKPMRKKMRKPSNKKSS